MAPKALLLIVALPLAMGRLLRPTELSFTDVRHGREATAMDMRPDVVAKLFSTVEEQWVDGEAAALQRGSHEAFADAAMQNSCMKVAKAVVDGADGKRERVNEYMEAVCGQDLLSPATKEMCHRFSHDVALAMRGDESFNREELDLSGFCQSFLSGAVATAAAAKKAELDLEADKQAKAAEAEALAERKAAYERSLKEAELQQAKAQKTAEEAQLKEAEATKAAQEEAAREEAQAQKKAAEEAALKKAREAKVLKTASTRQAEQSRSRPSNATAARPSNATSTRPSNVAVEKQVVNVSDVVAYLDRAADESEEKPMILRFSSALTPVPGNWSVEQKHPQAVNGSRA
mmetsp:Transcript_27405/g.59878  ORF Transcript_27405/g.59878 Transcript_27405/m.59878 type:complete len:346 (+) Transcript_27405:72-1109(+)